ALAGRVLVARRRAREVEEAPHELERPLALAALELGAQAPERPLHDGERPLALEGLLRARSAGHGRLGGVEVEREHAPPAAALQRGLVLVAIDEEVVERGAEVGPEAALPGVEPLEELAREEMREEALDRILAVLDREPLAPCVEIERLPVSGEELLERSPALLGPRARGGDDRPARLREGALRAAHRGLGDHAPDSNKEAPGPRGPGASVCGCRPSPRAGPDTAGLAVGKTGVLSSL